MTTDMEDRWLLLNDLAKRLKCSSFTLHIKLLLGIVCTQKEAQMLKLFFCIQRFRERLRFFIFRFPHEWVRIKKSHVKGFFPYKILLNERVIMLLHGIGTMGSLLKR